ncbi:MAG: hypothetical protein H6734_15145 [Alphaproteobacteria bacterium]|nr:hypothetical protein [Alphaproteobacteria bacterium]
MALGLLLVACDDGEVEEDPCPTVPALSWENFGKGHLDKHCNGCHSSQILPFQRNEAPVGVDFDTWPLTLQFAERIHVRGMATDFPMPPGGGPSAEELATFDEWMRCEVLPEAQ